MARLIQNRALFKARFGIFFLFLYLLPFVGTGAFWFNTNLQTEVRLTQDSPLYSDSSKTTWENLSLFRFSPKPKQQDTSSESDESVGENLDWNRWLLSHFLNELSKLECAKTGYIYRSSLLLNGWDIALFVLHHSWRTFL